MGSAANNRFNQEAQKRARIASGLATLRPRLRKKHPRQKFIGSTPNVTGAKTGVIDYFAA